MIYLIQINLIKFKNKIQKFKFKNVDNSRKITGGKRLRSIFVMEQYSAMKKE